MTRVVNASTDDVRIVAYDRLQALLFDAPLACTRERIAQVVGGIGPRLLGLAPRADVNLSAELFGACLPDPDDVEITPEGVAIVPIRGSFAPRAGLYEAMSGMVSYEETAGVVTAIAAKSAVKGLVLAIDSPGGTVAGVTEAAAAIAAIEKPVYAVASYQATSAAYWLACQCDRVYVPATATIGSIGVLAVRFDATKWDKEQGFAYTFVTTGERKADGHPHKPTSKDELAALQERIDQAAAMFFDVVAKARKLSVETIRDFEAGLFMGDAALEAGLADQVGSVADAVAALTKKITAQQARGLGFAATAQEDVPMAEQQKGQEGSGGGTPTADTSSDGKVIALADHQKAVTAATEKAASEATAAAQKTAQRITALCAIARRPELAAGYLKEGLTVEQVEEKLQALSATADAQLGGIRSHVDPSASTAAGGADAKFDVNALMQKQREQAIAHRAAGGR